MRTLDEETVLTLKEASEKYLVPVSWLRRQIGQPILPGGKLVRGIKFPADKNHYVFLSEMELITMPRVYTTEFTEETQRRYSNNPEDSFDDVS